MKKENLSKSKNLNKFFHKNLQKFLYLKNLQINNLKIFINKLNHKLTNLEKKIHYK